jgi:hypothetical protein
MRRRDALTVALISLHVIGLELIWTRLLSAEFFYTFAFLVLSLAIAGLGLGALAVRLSPASNRDHLLGPVLGMAALTALVGPPLVFRLGLRFEDLVRDPAMIGMLALAIITLGAPFTFAGMGLALLFRKHHDRIHRLYMADLLGAGAGVVVAIILMNSFGTPAATFLCTAPVLLAVFWHSRRGRKTIPVVLAAGLIGLCLAPGTLLEQKREERAPVIYKHWDAMAKIKVFEFSPEFRGINIDNAANSPVYGFDGNWDREEKFEFGIDVSHLINRFEDCTFLSLGSGGGSDVLQALQAGATEVHAVEVIPQINKMMLDGDPSGYLPSGPIPESAQEEGSDDDEAREDVPEKPGNNNPVITLAEFSGHIYNDPRVRVATEDARAYIGRFKNRFDLIYSLSSNSFAALASGSFALAENYLFTTEAFRDYWEALSGDGFMMMEHQFYMPRLAASLIDALEAADVEDPRTHFAVYDLPKMRRNILLISRQPLTDEIRNLAFGELTEENFDDLHLLYPAPEGLEDNLINRIVLDGWEAAAGDAPVDISPSTDDRPFVGQMGLWRNFGLEAPEKLAALEVFGYPLTKIMVLIIIAVVVLFLVPANLLPYLAKGENLKAAPWLYFFLIGAAFMAVEVVLIQKYTHFVGPSVYSIATILLTLLVAAGIGSRCAGGFGAGTPFVAIIVLILLDIVFARGLFLYLGELSLAWRMVVTALLVAPLGFFLGMPFPNGAMRVGELVDWGFAVNGSGSMFGATGILLVAFTWGFRVALLTAAATYLIAFGLLALKSGWNRPAARL